jgi:hypothetical protein
MTLSTAISDSARELTDDPESDRSPKPTARLSRHTNSETELE